MKNSKQLYIFLSKALALYILWEVVYKYWIHSKTNIEGIMTSGIASLSSQLMRFWGYNSGSVDIFEKNIYQFSEIILDKTPLVIIANACNGLTLMALFIGFIIAYPGNWKLKLIFISVGSVLIYLINLIRIQILLFNSMVDPESFEFNHKYTFTIAVYLCVFTLWMLWVNRFSTRKSVLISSKVDSKTY